MARLQVGVKRGVMACMLLRRLITFRRCSMLHWWVVSILLGRHRYSTHLEKVARSQLDEPMVHSVESRNAQYCRRLQQFMFVLPKARPRRSHRLQIHCDEYRLEVRPENQLHERALGNAPRHRSRPPGRAAAAAGAAATSAALRPCALQKQFAPRFHGLSVGAADAGTHGFRSQGFVDRRTWIAAERLRRQMISDCGR